MTLRKSATDVEQGRAHARTLIDEIKVYYEMQAEGVSAYSPVTKVTSEQVARETGTAMGEIVERLKFCMSNPDAALTFVNDQPMLIDKIGEWDYETLFKVGRTNNSAPWAAR